MSNFTIDIELIYIFLIHCVGEDKVISNLPVVASDNKTVVRKLLEDSVNGNQIVSRHLDSYMTTTNNNPDSEDFAVEINFKGIVNFERNSPKQFRALYDIFDILKKRSHYEKEYPLITHPVIALFIWKKWRKARYLFYVTFIAYLVFIGFYSWMVSVIFEKKNLCENYSAQSQSISMLFIEVGMIISVVFLLIWEFFQAFRLRMLYFREIENFIELFVFLSSFCLVFYKVMSVC